MKTIHKFVLSVSSAALAMGAYAIAAHHEEIDAEVRAFFEQATADFAACNVEAIGKYDAKGHTGIYPDSLDPIDETSEAAVQEGKTFCENGGKHEISYEISNVIPLNGAAVAVGKGHYKRTEPDGTVTLDTDYSFTDVLVKTDDGWKFRHTHIGMAIPMGDEMDAAAADEAAQE